MSNESSDGQPYAEPTASSLDLTDKNIRVRYNRATGEVIGAATESVIADYRRLTESAERGEFCCIDSAGATRMRRILNAARPTEEVGRE